MIESQLSAGAYRGASQKLEKDIRKRIEKWLHDDYEVAATNYDKDEILALVADFQERVEGLDTTGRGNGRNK